MTTAIVYHPDYLQHETGAHPEQPARALVIEHALRELTGAYQWLTPRPATATEIGYCHVAGHYDVVRQACENSWEALDEDTIICPKSLEVSLLATGGVLTAIDQVASRQADNAFVVVRPPGHHATPERAMGFCLFNNVAIGARYAQQQHNLERILIVDWDVHHGNGTQDIFYEDSSVCYFSLHQYPHYPGTGRATETGKGKGQGYTLNIPLPGGTSAPSYRQAFDEGLAKVVTKMRPDLILISAGFDSHKEDPLGQLRLDIEDFVWLTQRLKQLAADCGHGRVVSALEGGYNLRKLGEIAAAHVVALASEI